MPIKPIASDDRRMGKGADVAPVVSCLLPDAADRVAGAQLVSDGGTSLHSDLIGNA